VETNSLTQASFGHGSASQSLGKIAKQTKSKTTSEKSIHSKNTIEKPSYVWLTQPGFVSKQEVLQSTSLRRHGHTIASSNTAAARSRNTQYTLKYSSNGCDVLHIRCQLSFTQYRNANLQLRSINCPLSHNNGK